MKKIIIFALLPFASLALADVLPASSPNSQGDNTSAIQEQNYTYSTHLDIAKVLSTDDVSAICGIVPVKMTYEDSQGKTHTLRYMMMGGGCSNN